MICGLPSSSTYFAADLCRDLLMRRHGSCEIINLNDLGSATAERIASIAGPTLFLAEIPDAAVAAMVREANFPIVVLDQGFAAACRDFMAARDAKLLDAVRTMARGQMGVYALTDIPRAAVIAAHGDQSALVLAKLMASALGVSTDLCRQMAEVRNLDRPLAEVLDEIFVYEKMPHDDEVDELLAKLERFYGLPLDESSMALDVPMIALLEAVAPYLPATNVINLVGPARCLTFGPYFFLPDGRWRATFTFLSSDNVSLNTLGFDITCEQEIKVDRSFEMRQAGKFAFNCEFEIRDSLSPIEFRTFLRRGSIGGQFTPLSLTFNRIGNGVELSAKSIASSDLAQSPHKIIP